MFSSTWLKSIRSMLQGASPQTVARRRRTATTLRTRLGLEAMEDRSMPSASLSISANGLIALSDPSPNTPVNVVVSNTTTPGQVQIVMTNDTFSSPVLATALPKGDSFIGNTGLTVSLAGSN